jgi:two-component system chemotaxis response regulator CheB
MEGQAMPSPDIVVIGASAGGIEALSRLLKGLPPKFPAAIFVVLHIAPQSPGYLPEILARAGNLPAENARDGKPFQHGRVYVAPPDRHLMLEADDCMRVVRGPKENRARPAVDPLFRSAALAFGPRVVGVVLSGGLDDGTAGLQGIKMCGGIAIVQDPADAVVSSMPATALRHVSVDYCRPARDIGPLLAELVTRPLPHHIVPEAPMRKQLEIEVDIAKGSDRSREVTRIGQPSMFTCPECHGTLLRIRGDKPWRFRCHTGHAFTADSLLAELTEATEESIWSAVRSIQESAMLMTHLADHWRDTDPDTAALLVRKAEAAQRRADLVRDAAAAQEVESEEKIQAKAR